MMSYPQGKGMFIWLLAECAGGNPVSAAAKAHEAGISWVAIKVQHQKATYQPSLLEPALQAFRAAGISVWGWGYVVGANYLRQSIAAAEAAKTLEVVAQFDLDGFFIDAEAEYKRSGAATWAATYTTSIRAAMPSLPLGLCSYRFPSLHPELPWGVFLSRCDFHAPQVYWEFSHNPQYQLQRSYQELTALKSLPIIPLGSAYARGDWAPTVNDIDSFNGTAKQLGLPGISWWSWQSAESNAMWWNAISAHEWAPPMPPPLTLEERVTALEAEARAHGWNIP